MGIDIYLEWKDKTKDEADAQCTGFSTVDGDKGYLREAYHGGPYATHVLISEDWGEQPYDENDESKCGFVIPNTELVARLPKVVETSIKRNKNLYKATDEEAKEYAMAFVEFVQLHKKLEDAGKEPRIYISY
jgi:hypothetical protein